MRLPCHGAPLLYSWSLRVAPVDLTHVHEHLRANSLYTWLRMTSSRSKVYIIQDILPPFTYSPVLCSSDRQKFQLHVKRRPKRAVVIVREGERGGGPHRIRFPTSRTCIKERSGHCRLGKRSRPFRESIDAIVLVASPFRARRRFSTTVQASGALAHPFHARARAPSCSASSGPRHPTFGVCLASCLRRIFRPSLRSARDDMGCVRLTTYGKFER